MLRLVNLVSILFFLVGFISDACADIVYLRNGRSMEGLITKEDDQEVQLSIGIGTVRFRRIEIESIHKSGPEETALIRKEWEDQKQKKRELRLERELELEEARQKESLLPKEIQASQTGDHMIVSALLNDRVKASLLLDTGASLILISNQIAQQLEIETGEPKQQTITAMLADGRQVEAYYIVLESVNVQGAEAKQIPAYDRTPGPRLL